MKKNFYLFNHLNKKKCFDTKKNILLKNFLCYNPEIDFNKIKNLSNFFKKIGIEISTHIQKKLIKFFEIEILTNYKNIEINNHLYNSIKKKTIYNLSFTYFENQKNYILIYLPVNFTHYIINKLFGFKKNKENIKNKNENYINSITTKHFNKKIIILITKKIIYFLQKKILLNMNILYFKFFTNKKEIYNDIINKNIVKISFELIIDDWKEILYCEIPFIFIKFLKNKKKNIPINNIFDEKNKSISVKNINNVKIEIIAKLTNIRTSFSKISNLSIGDIIPIKKPKKIIFFLENKPILNGNLINYNMFYSCYIKNFIKNK
ncbi:FliM/FliN family flagellar motor switch protein [Buchnera aphidicola (Kurisakia onigurumii)]|uniref:FliM/FliN family flagellar motor switch protein n=1 Tax=Buchnera aphidicola TaxID=9 RepID=UPI0031B6B2E8